MRLNPKKGFFGVDSEKLLGFILYHRKIEVETKKINAVINIPNLKNISQLCTLQGMIQDFHHFMALLVDQTLPFTQLLKKESNFKWSEDFKQDFESLKEYLTTPPILQPAIQEKPFILYISTFSHALAALLAQQDDNGKDRLVYNISQTLIDYETR